MYRILASTLVLALGATPILAADAPSAPAATPAAPAAPAAKPAVKKASSGATFKTEDERTFYAYGYKMGQNLKTTSPSAGEASAIAQGLRDALTGKPEAVPMAVYLPKVSEMATKRMSAKADTEKKKGLAYIDKFTREDGILPIPLGDGFIKTITEGKGAQPTADDTVKVNYRGTLIDGTEFDSSYKRNSPATFPLKNVIPCWTNGVAMMKVGGKSKLVCPADIAYGDQGRPPLIAGGATLVFEIELLDIVKDEAPAEAAPASKPSAAKAPVKK
ncbi:MAG: FKBP-type peptidyl-prolyl cis-trans isomerase [Elusimicrobiota bacterium]